MYGALIIEASAVWAAAFLAVGFDIIVAKLTNLDDQSGDLTHTGKVLRQAGAVQRTYLIPTRARPEVLVREVKLFYAKGARNKRVNQLAFGWT